MNVLAQRNCCKRRVRRLLAERKAFYCASTRRHACRTAAGMCCAAKGACGKAAQHRTRSQDSWLHGIPLHSELQRAVLCPAMSYRVGVFIRKEDPQALRLRASNAVQTVHICANETGFCLWRVMPQAGHRQRSPLHLRAGCVPQDVDPMVAGITHFSGAVHPHG